MTTRDFLSMDTLVPRRFRSRWQRIAMLLLALPCHSLRGQCPDPAPIAGVLRAQLQKYPAMAIPDALKFLQQSIMGSEHWAVDSAEAAGWMQKEWSTLGNGPVESLIDTLGPDRRFARVNLRPYRRAGGSPVTLVAAFVRTGREVRGSRPRLACALSALTTMARRHTVPWNADSLARFIPGWAHAGYPALDHSPGYEAQYHPAYRVVAVRLLADLIATLR